MSVWEAEDTPPEAAEQFWRQVVAAEKAGWVSTFSRLERAGLEMPPPDELDDQGIRRVLQEMGERLTALGVSVLNTAHLNDRELYEHLWHDALREETVVMPGCAWTIDLVGSGSEEHTALFMRYYADARDRRSWMKNWPDYEMPPHEDPPYPRDWPPPPPDV